MRRFPRWSKLIAYTIIDISALLLIIVLITLFVLPGIMTVLPEAYDAIARNSEALQAAEDDPTALLATQESLKPYANQLLWFVGVGVFVWVMIWGVFSSFSWHDATGRKVSFRTFMIRHMIHHGAASVVVLGVFWLLGWFMAFRDLQIMPVVSDVLFWLVSVLVVMIVGYGWLLSQVAIGLNSVVRLKVWRFVVCCLGVGGVVFLFFVVPWFVKVLIIIGSLVGLNFAKWWIMPQHIYRR